MWLLKIFSQKANPIGYISKFYQTFMEEIALCKRFQKLEAGNHLTNFMRPAVC